MYIREHWLYQLQLFRAKREGERQKAKKQHFAFSKVSQIPLSHNTVQGSTEIQLDLRLSGE